MRILWCLLVGLLAAIPAHSGEPLRYTGENSLYQDTVWEGEVLIDGILTVAPEATLEIRPGTVVRFTPYDSNGDGIGEHEIFIQGVFRALGTADAPILFTSAAPSPSPGDWGALNMMASEEDNLLEHCIVEYGYRGFHAHFARAAIKTSRFRYNVRGAQFQESTVDISDSEVVDNLNGLQFRNSEVNLEGLVVARNHWGMRCVFSEVAMAGCRFEENLINGVSLRDSSLVARGNRVVGNRKGLYLQRSTGEVEGNDLSGNSEHGIFLEESDVRVSGNRIADNGRAGIRWLDSSGALSGNLIQDNGIYALLNDGAGPVQAPGNWWGTTSAQELRSMIRDGRQRPGMGPVEIEPVLKEAPPFKVPPLPERKP
ncbi:hypothetical protein DESUT3_24130 [Desulfuromonas versatilis]|uniref:Periplasmic copper-binding protein NosD beta helix domain-containing protein n=1 Tax=Desulfuromonas versatilis TaxID=2802975 RepID=A0ABN6E1J4_9BACT|nr:right-handed parallel beta-helix repeat-containing protein [Desulfuromonas versatilis]BCR05344.1 hypothetical protein DESUT3_24130 [Desulfuromonas versatilis]